MSIRWPGTSPTPGPAFNAAPLRSSILPGITGWAQVRFGYANDILQRDREAPVRLVLPQAPEPGTRSAQSSAETFGAVLTDRGICPDRDLGPRGSELVRDAGALKGEGQGWINPAEWRSGETGGLVDSELAQLILLR